MSRFVGHATISFLNFTPSLSFGAASPLYRNRPGIAPCATCDNTICGWVIGKSATVASCLAGVPR